MKPVLVFLVALALSLQSGCSESTQPSAKEVYVSIEVETAFQNDLVSLLLDDKSLLESLITTNYTISLAWSSGLKQLSNDYHSLYFSVIGYGVHKGFTMDMSNDTSTVTINFDKTTRQIRFQQYKGILLRR